MNDYFTHKSKVCLFLSYGYHFKEMIITISQNCIMNFIAMLTLDE